MIDLNEASPYWYPGRDLALFSPYDIGHTGSMHTEYVSEYGAPTSGGNITTALMAAYAAVLENGGGMVRIPAGFYTLDPAVVLVAWDSKPVTLVGAGRGATVLSGIPDAGQALIDWTGYYESGGIRDLTLSAPEPCAGVGLRVGGAADGQGVVQWHSAQVSIRGAFALGFELRGSPVACMIYGMSTAYATQGMRLTGANQVAMLDCFVDGNAEIGLEISGHVRWHRGTIQKSDTSDEPAVLIRSGSLVTMNGGTHFEINQGDGPVIVAEAGVSGGNISLKDALWNQGGTGVCLDVSANWNVTIGDWAMTNVTKVLKARNASLIGYGFYGSDDPGLFDVADCRCTWLAPGRPLSNAQTPPPVP